MSNKIIVIGSSGHATVIIDVLEQLNYQIVGCIDSFAPKGKKTLDYEVLGDEFILENTSELGTNQVFIAIGNNFHRKEMYEKLLKINPNLEFPSIISPHAIISPTVKIGFGNIIMDRVVIHANSEIGDFNLINTSSVIEHNCIISSFASLSPNTILCGNVIIENLVFLGASVTIIQKIKILNNSFVAAGSVVISDCDSNSLYTGIPAKKKRSNYLNINYL